MFKLKYFIFVLTLIMTWSSQTYAKEVKPIFGMYKVTTADTDEYLDQSWSKIYLIDEAAKKYPNLQKALKAYNDELNQDVSEAKSHMHEEAKIISKERPDLFHAFYRKDDIIVRRADSSAVSFIHTFSDYAGGAHGMYGYSGVNFDTVSGQRLHIYDICNNAEKLTEIIINSLKNTYPREPFVDIESKIADLVVSDNINWSLEYDGVSFYFNPYEIAAYASGLLKVTILFDEQPDLFKEKYKQIPKEYCQSLLIYYQNIFAEKGKRNKIEINSSADECSIIFNGNEIDENIMDPLPVLVHMSNGKNYIYIDSIDGIHVYSLKQNKPQFIKTLPYTFKHMETDKSSEFWIMNDPNAFQFESFESINGITSHFGSVNENGTISFG